ncbi:hypothetical protein ACHHYP_16508 [Achlya hypogyna]|uniref:Uncharacterized protein n=1 Tax=Achlya hypogyna TaxID=1202772 RepID=A0A1V9Y6D8_ACHHY|nr:hypothetical protein ACHHYP_16508 [Achlya hypogyna]
MGATRCADNVFCNGKSSSCPVDEKAHDDGKEKTMVAYLSDTVTQCSAKAISIGSSQFTAMYSSTPSSVIFVVAAAVVAVVASALVAKEAKRHVSMEDGYACLTEDVN